MGRGRASCRGIWWLHCDYWLQVQGSLLTSIGPSEPLQYGVQASAIDPLGIYHLQVPSVYLDGLTRYGLVWLLVMLGVFAIAFKEAWVDRTGPLRSRSIALVMFLFLAGSTETIHSSACVTIDVLALVYVVGVTLPTHEIDKS